jgi:hypothetical protein
MTYLQPHAKPSFPSFYKFLTMGLVALGVVSILGLVGLYNAVVSERHALADTGRAMTTLQTGNVNLEQQLFLAFDVNAVDAFAASRGLVKERDPRYLEGTSATWALASALHY